MQTTYLSNKAIIQDTVKAVAAGGMLTLLSLLSACATTPDRIPELETARATVQSVDRKPMAEQVAGAELKEAKEALQRADSLKADRADVQDIVHQAYLARRHAEIADARIEEAQARARIEESEAKRTQVQLQAREQEAMEARAEAELNERKAQRAMNVAEARARDAERRAMEAEQQRARAERALEEVAELESALEELSAEQTERGMVLTLGDVLFDTNEAVLKPGANNAMDRIAAFLNSQSDRHLLIEGHTDSRGADDYNQSLSARRADAVRTALMERGISNDRLRSKGLGEAYPVATNDNEAGRQQNRRVEIVVSDEEGTFPAVAEQRSAATN